MYILNPKIVKEAIEMARKSKGFVRLPVEAIQDTRLSRAALTVLAIVLDRCDERGECRISHDRIAAAAGVSERTVRRAIESLEVCEYLEVVREQGKPSKYVQRDVLPPKRRRAEDLQRSSCSEADPQEDPTEKVLAMWAEAGVFEKIG